MSGLSVGSQLAAAEAGKAALPDGAASGELSICHLAAGDCWAGAETQLASLLRALVRRREGAVRAILLNEGRLAQEARACGVEVKVIPESQIGFFQILAEATSYLQSKGVQVLHSHRYKDNLLACLLRWKCGVPVVLRSHHGLLEALPGFPLKRTMVNVLERALARYFTDCVICVSADLRTRLEVALRPRQCVTVLNGLEAERVRSPLSVTEAKRALGISSDSVVIGTAGRLERVKRLDIFLSAAKLLAGEFKTAQFLIVGTGGDVSRLQQLAAALGLEERVRFPGHRDDVFDVLRAMDIFILCSDHEGMPMALLEALALGVPTISRAVGGVTEVVADGVNGVLIRSDDPSTWAEACRLLMEDEAKRQRLAEAGKVTVEQKFSIDATAAALCQLYRAMVRAKARP